MKRVLRLLGFFVCCLVVAALVIVFYGPYYTGLVKPDRYFYQTGLRCSCGGAEFDVIDQGSWYQLNPYHRILKRFGYMQQDGDKTYLMLSTRGHLYRAGLFDPKTHQYDMLDLKDPSKHLLTVPHAAPWRVLIEFYWVDAYNRLLGY